MEDTPVSNEQAEAAIDWLVRLRADDVSEIEEHQFIDWLGKNRENQLAFVEALSFWDGLSVVSDLEFSGFDWPGLDLSDAVSTDLVLSEAEYDGLNALRDIFEFKRKFVAAIY